MAVDDDAIGLVRAHRWADIKIQTKALKDAGCSRIFDLDGQKRADLERVISRQPAKLLYAFFLAEPDRTRSMWADITGAVARIEAKGGSVVDVASGLDSKANPEAFRDVVRGQVRRHNQGDKSADNHPKGTPGRPEAVYSPGGWRKAYGIWKGKDAVNHPTWRAAETALAEIKATNTGEPFSMARAHLKWGKRPKIPKA